MMQWTPEGGVGFPGTGVTDGCQLPFVFWESNPGPQKEQQVLLTAEPSLSSRDFLFSEVTDVHTAALRCTGAGT